MFTLPPIPPFEAIHPALVHFPIGILLVAWLPMLVALIDRKRRHTWLAAAALLLIVGVIAAFIATWTGEAAKEIAVATSQQVEDAIHEHEETAETARNLFAAVTILYLAVWITAAKVKAIKSKRTLALIGGLLVAIAYTLAALALLNAARLGGELVHVHGIRAPI